MDHVLSALLRVSAPSSTEISFYFSFYYSTKIVVSLSNKCSLGNPDSATPSKMAAAVTQHILKIVDILGTRTLHLILFIQLLESLHQTPLRHHSSSSSATGESAPDSSSSHHVEWTSWPSGSHPIFKSSSSNPILLFIIHYYEQRFLYFNIIYC